MNRNGLLTLINREMQRFLRVFVQTLISPWINAVLYIFIFGFVVGQKIESIAGVPYIMFVLPGILMLNVVSSSFQQTAFSLYFKRFARHIEELLTAPLSDAEILIGHIVGAIVRAIIVGAGIFVIAILFDAAQVVHLWWFIFYVIGVASLFALIGLLIGLWSDSFEQLSILNTFIITPLTYLGGMFNSVDMLPTAAQQIVRWNPFFYFVDGLRYAMTGVSEANQLIGVMVIVGLNIVFFIILWTLFHRGWRLRG